MCRKLLGILSMKRGLPVRRTWVSARYLRPSSCNRSGGNSGSTAGYRDLSVLPSRPERCSASRGISASSIVPSTCECEARICSRRVEPARGSPTMNIGSSRSKPVPRRLAKNSRVQTVSCWRAERSRDLDFVAALALLQRIAALVVLEGLRIIGAILQRLAERETQVISVRQCSGVRMRSYPHARDLVVGEAIGLEIRKTPVGIAEIRLRHRGLPVCINGFATGVPGSLTHDRWTDAGRPPLARLPPIVDKSPTLLHDARARPKRWRGPSGSCGCLTPR